ncbi:MAG TPA: NAD(P)H-quinone oxidoreductase [Candidatus Baltobacteraceae bacterium]|jgi:NADPH2:quinone reductase|nr:NAD(P)H-quinone oxidoreductase [Candidatus Baltobacteraceae bacterium]
MKVVEFAEPGEPAVLRVGERPKPVPKLDEVLIAVSAAGVSRADAMQRKGAYPPPAGASDILGLEVAGTDEQTGAPVCALLSGGGYAEYVAVPREQVLPAPQGWTAVEAATLPENMLTVYDNVWLRAHLQAQESILIHGGSSGIGTTAIMLARAFRAGLVIVTAGTEEKCAACRRLGADLALNYRTSDFVEQVASVTGGRGVDVIVDMVGGDYIARDLHALAADGRIVSIAAPTGQTAQVDLRLLMQRRGSIMASALRARTPQEKGAIARALLQHVWPLLPARNPIRPVVDSVFPFEQAAQAHERLESSAHIGKIVLVPTSALTA